MMWILVLVVTLGAPPVELEHPTEASCLMEMGEYLSTGVVRARCERRTVQCMTRGGVRGG